MKVDWSVWGKKLRALFDKYKFVFLVILVGVVLLLLPAFGGGGEKEKTPTAASAAASEEFSVEAMEHKLEEALSQVDGAGNATVVLTVRAGPRQVLAQDGKQSDKESTSSTVVVSKGSGTEDAVVLQQIYPQYQGALVVCPGGGEAAVRLKIIDAVSALTGLGSDKISVCKSK